MTFEASKERTMYYGKGDVWVFRSYAKPLTGVKAIPESAFRGRENVLFGMNIKVAVKGEKFITSFTEGDNSLVVATDSMKNFILRHAADFTGATVEGFLEFASRQFLETYPQMTGVRMTAEQVPFEQIQVGNAESIVPSDLVFKYSHNESASATVVLERENSSINVVSHQSGVMNLRLIKVKGSGFAGFVRDEYTTLPETSDRPLFIFLNIHWKYTETEDGLDDLRGNYVDAEQVRDIAATVFHENNSPSIQNLIYLIGLRVLHHFSQLAEVSFESNNRTWETIVETVAEGPGSVFTEPRPPYGFQGFSMTRNDLADALESEAEKAGSI
ncbi:factor-independent urate hydroxylase [Paenibacillus sp. Marseille-Q4541]|uniref:factor-independent urate hydroxylase n=1 Tax=Paenibacillus sp. Marseille-Q4541 TaxID=2831522 RepID=UPI0020196E27|nr:urate oxidase [Paenibacillus sp. Marseille-Q4541]